MSRALEAEGLATVVVQMERGHHERLKQARTLVVKFPFGRPFGREHDAANQRVVVEECLRLLESATGPELREPGYRWRREDWGAVLVGMGVRAAGGE